MKVEGLNFASVDSIKRMEEKTYSSKPYVYWGVDNLFPEQLLETLNLSATHSACVQARVDYCTGTILPENDFKVNKNQTISQLLHLIYQDINIMGNAAVEIIYKKDRTQGIAGLYHIPVQNLRMGKLENYDDEDRYYYYADDWSKQRQSTLIKYTGVDPSSYESRQILWIYNGQPGTRYYSPPYYMSVLNNIRLDHQIGLFHLSNITRNGLAGLWINFPTGTQVSAEEQSNILRKIEDRFVGAENGGRIMVSFSQGSDEKPEITQLSTSTHDNYYTEIFELNQRTILAGNKVSSGLLIGLPGAAGFSANADELAVASNHFLQTTIIPIQEQVLSQLQPVVDMLNPQADMTIKVEQKVMRY